MGEITRLNINVLESFMKNIKDQKAKMQNQIEHFSKVNQGLSGWNDQLKTDFLNECKGIIRSLNNAIIELEALERSISNKINLVMRYKGIRF